MMSAWGYQVSVSRRRPWPPHAWWASSSPPPPPPHPSGGCHCRRALRTPIPVPTLLLWADSDAALGTGLLRGTGRHVGQLQVEVVPQSSHWIQHDRPERVNAALGEFLI